MTQDEPTQNTGMVVQLRAAIELLNTAYPLPWQVALRSYDHEQVIASGNRVLACAGNTEQRKAIVEFINAVPRLLDLASHSLASERGWEESRPPSPLPPRQ